MPTRQLPDHPDFRHIRLQAKTLLKEFLAGDPDACARVARIFPAKATLTLSGAQTVIAREYGLRSWPRLVARVHALHHIHGQTIEALTPEILDQIVELYPHCWGKCERALERAGHAGIDALIRGLKHRSARVRCSCANYFDRHRDPRGIDALCRHVNDPVPKVRQSVIHSLGCEHCSGKPLEDQHVKYVQEACLNDTSLKVRRGAAFLLGQQLSDVSARKVLHALLLRDTEQEVRTMARQALSNHGRLCYGRKAENAIQKLLGAPEWIDERVENGPPRMLYYDLGRLTGIANAAPRYWIRLIVKSDTVASVNVIEDTRTPVSNLRGEPRALSQ